MIRLKLCRWPVSLLLLLSTGCCSSTPDGPEPPPFDPASAGRQAIAEYDTNGDGKLSQEEAAASPALTKAYKRIDMNSDGSLDRDEITARVEYLLNAPTRIVMGSANVTLDGKPLEGATVTLEPEPFMGDAIKTLTDVTNQHGDATLTGHNPDFDGIFLGYYRVRISKRENGKELLPARYNSETELGYEAADDIPEMEMFMQYELTSR